MTIMWSVAKSLLTYLGVLFEAFHQLKLLQACKAPSVDIEAKRTSAGMILDLLDLQHMP